MAADGRARQVTLRAVAALTDLRVAARENKAIRQALVRNVSSPLRPL
jgi:hypothetical protein